MMGTNHRKQVGIPCLRGLQAEIVGVNPTTGNELRECGQSQTPLTGARNPIDVRSCPARHIKEPDTIERLPPHHQRLKQLHRSGAEREAVAASNLRAELGAHELLDQAKHHIQLGMGLQMISATR